MPTGLDRSEPPAAARRQSSPVPHSWLPSPGLISPAPCRHEPTSDPRRGRRRPTPPPTSRSSSRSTTRRAQLAASITALRTFLDASFPFGHLVTVVDNASTDDTWRWPAAWPPASRASRPSTSTSKGRGRALRAAWSASRAPVVAYMDVDLSTGLRRPPAPGGPAAVRPQRRGHRHPAGPRRPRGARGPARADLAGRTTCCSRTALRGRVHRRPVRLQGDAPRGGRRSCCPWSRTTSWFFDTELLVTARAAGPAHPRGARWTGSTTSTRGCDVVRTAWHDLRGVARMIGRASRRRWPRPGCLPRPAAARRRRPRRPADRRPSPATGGQDDEVFADELLRFAGVGRRQHLGLRRPVRRLEPWLGRLRGQRRRHRHLQPRQHGRPPRACPAPAAARLDRAPAAWSCAGGLLGGEPRPSPRWRSSSPGPSGSTRSLPELVAVTVANLVAAVFRFAILRTWVFRPRFGTRLPPAPAAPASAATVRPCRRSATDRTPTTAR